MTLRPELTAGVVRSYIQNNLQQVSPVQKLWYEGPMFRQERPQKGRLRQFNQFGFEIIGTIPEGFNHKELGFVDAHIMFKKL